ncbi:MAG: hypothetical protein NTW33_10980 [Methanoregula sp.]|nr:hypothetical protein [Methanoregula sp.]
MSESDHGDIEHEVLTYTCPSRGLEGYVPIFRCCLNMKIYVICSACGFTFTVVDGERK